MVVHVDDSTVTVAVTTDSVGAGGMVTVPETTADSEAAGAADDEAADCNWEPIDKAELLKLVNELAAPSGPQLTAKTIPAPQ